MKSVIEINGFFTLYEILGIPKLVAKDYTIIDEIPGQNLYLISDGSVIKAVNHQPSYFYFPPFEKVVMATLPPEPGSIVIPLHQSGEDEEEVIFRLRFNPTLRGWVGSTQNRLCVIDEFREGEATNNNDSSFFFAIGCIQKFGILSHLATSTPSSGDSIYTLCLSRAGWSVMMMYTQVGSVLRSECQHVSKLNNNIANNIAKTGSCCCFYYHPKTNVFNKKMTNRTGGGDEKEKGEEVEVVGTHGVVSSSIIDPELVGLLRYNYITLFFNYVRAISLQGTGDNTTNQKGIDTTAASSGGGSVAWKCCDKIFDKQLQELPFYLFNRFVFGAKEGGILGDVSRSANELVFLDYVTKLGCTPTSLSLPSIIDVLCMVSPRVVVGLIEEMLTCSRNSVR